MATVPISGTNIRLLSGIPFSNDYKNTRWFDTKNEQTTYFLSKSIVHSESQMNFQRVEGLHFVAINKSIDELWGTNYLMFQNAQYNSKWFYAFVTKLEYVQKNRTNVHFEIDVLQTWKFEMNFKPSFVIREHCDLWDKDGNPVLNTVDEGLDYGTDYETVSLENYLPYETIYFLIIVSKETLHGTQEIKPILNGLPQPLSYYVHPFKLDGSSPKINIGANPFAISAIEDVLKSIYKNEDSVNNVVSLYVTEYFGYKAEYDNETDTLTFDPTTFEQARISDNSSGNMNTLNVASFPDYNELTTYLSKKYTGYRSVKESKLLMYPYTCLVLDDFKGNRVVLKNEYIKGNTISINTKGSLGVSNKVSYSLPNYLLDESEDFSQQANIENALINNNPNDIPILSDYLSAYLQGNRNSLENQKNSIMWNGLMGGINSTVGGVASGLQGNMIGVASGGLGVINGMGSTQLQLAGIEAKKKDIDNLPPQMVKMGSNTNFDYGNRYSGLYILKKQITPEYQRKLEQYFNLFGYKKNEVKLPNFHTRKYWNYVQTSSCVILGNFNNEDLTELKTIFDNGITFWHTDDIGNYELENEVI